MQNEETRKAWEQQLKEPSVWFYRFDAYFRPLGPERTIENAWRQWKKAESKESKGKRPSKHWYRIAQEWGWGRRSKLWDELKRQERIKANEQATTEMIERQIQLSRGMQTVGGKKLQLLNKSPNDLTPNEARQFIESGVKMERQGRGLPEHLLAISTMSNEEIERQYASLINAIAPTGDVASGDETTGDTDPAGESKD